MTRQPAEGGPRSTRRSMLQTTVALTAAGALGHAAKNAAQALRRVHRGPRGGCSNPFAAGATARSRSTTCAPRQSGWISSGSTCSRRRISPRSRSTAWSAP